MTLYERILAATGPDRELDVLIWAELAKAETGRGVVVRISRHNGEWCAYREGEGERLMEVHKRGFPRMRTPFTASVDAALGLVGDVKGWTLGRYGDEYEFLPAVDDGLGLFVFNGIYPKSAALAICAAVARKEGW